MVYAEQPCVYYDKIIIIAWTFKIYIQSDQSLLIIYQL